jgi:hypothetical protein
VLLVEAAPDPFLERVGAEIGALGFALVRGAAPGALEDAAREAQAVVAIRVLPSRKGVEVWMADETSGRSLLRQVIVDEGEAGPNEGLIALQTAELLRTSLLTERSPAQKNELHSEEPAAAHPAPTSPPVTDGGVQGALGFLYSPGGANAALQVCLSLQRSIGPHVGVAVDASGPLRSATLSNVEGSTSVGTYFVAASAFAKARAPASPFFANLGVGLAVMRITFSGETHAPLVPSSDHTLTAASYLRGDAGVEPARWLRLGARGLAGLTADRVDLRFAGNQAGSYGHSFFAAFALAEVPWY